MAIRGISFNYKASVRLKQSASNSAGFQYQKRARKTFQVISFAGLFKQLPPLQVLQAPVLRN